MQSTVSVDLIHPDPPDPGKKIFRCGLSAVTLKTLLGSEQKSGPGSGSGSSSPSELS